MDFKEFIKETHPDPDFVFGVDKYAFEQIVLFAENYASYKRQSELELFSIGKEFIKKLIEKEEALQVTLVSNMKLYKDKNRLDLYESVFDQWNKCNLVLWDLKDALCRMGENPN